MNDKEKKAFVARMKKGRAAAARKPTKYKHTYGTSTSKGSISEDQFEKFQYAKKLMAKQGIYLDLSGLKIRKRKKKSE